MGIKSRGNFQVLVCFKDCLNRGKECDNCIGFSKLKERPKNKCNHPYVRSGK